MASLAEALAKIGKDQYNSGLTSGAAQALRNAQVASQGIGKGLIGAGDEIGAFGTDLQTYATNQLAAQLAAKSRAGMELDPVTGQPIDPTGQGVAELMAQARAAQQNVDPLLLDRIEPIPAIRDSVTGEITQEGVPGRSGGVNPNFNPSNLAGMVNFKSLSDTADRLGKDRRDAAEELRKIAAEKQLRSLDPYKLEQEKWQAELLEQKKNLNALQETRTQAKHELDQLQLKAKTKLTKAERTNLLKDIALKRKEISQKDREWNLKNQKLQADINFTRRTTTSIDVEDEKRKAETGKIEALTDVERENLEKLQRENKKARKLEQDKIIMAPQFEKIMTAQAADAKAGITDFSNSSEFREYNRLFNLNRKNRRKNDALQAEFAERISNLDLPITPAQLIEAGVVLTNKAGEIVGYDYSPSAKTRLDRVLAIAYKDQFGTFGKPSATLIGQLRKSAIAQNAELSVGFKDAADIAAKDLDTRNERDFTRALQRGASRIDALEAGSERSKTIAELRKTLTDMPWVKDKPNLLDAALQKYSDEDLANTPIKFAVGKFGTTVDPKMDATDPKFGKVAWDQKEMAKYGLSPIDLKSKNTKLATFTTFEADVRTKLKKEHKRSSDTAIAKKASLALSRIPGYVDARINAKLKQEATDLANAEVVKGPSLIAADVAKMTQAIESDGVIAYMDTYLRTNHKPAYARSDPGDLKIEMQDMITKAENLYDGQIRDKITGKVKLQARAELYHAVLKMYAGSTGNSVAWWHNTTGAIGTEEGSGFLWLFDKGLDELSDDQFRTAISPYLPNNLLTGKLTKEEKIVQLEAQLAAARKE
jgi:hypothetical protein